MANKWKVPLTGSLGAGTGVALGTLAAEWTARSAGQTGWNACGIKGLVKFVIGMIGYAVSPKLEGLSSFFAEMFAYGTWGSILMDIALAAYPGGIPGLAEDWAIGARTLAAGGRRVSAVIRRVESKAGAVTAPKAKAI